MKKKELFAKAIFIFSIIFFIFILYGLLSPFIYDNEEDSNNDEIPMTKMFHGIKQTAIPGKNYNITIYGTIPEYDYISQKIIFNISEIDLSKTTKIEWYIDYQYVNSSNDFTYVYWFDKTYYPSSSIVELWIYDGTNITKLKSNINFQFIELEE